jgi:DNA repair photolyase
MRIVNEEIPDRPVKGRGAAVSPEGRFESLRHQREDDGWFPPEEEDRPRTTLGVDRARRVLTDNNSPDVGFSRSLNPYRGCEHGCTYCLSGDTPILMGDGSTRPLAELRVGDHIYGSRREGWYRRYVPTQVLAHFSSIKPAWRLTLADGTALVASGDHRFLTERGWKFVTGAEQGQARRRHLTLTNKLMGTGAFAAMVEKDATYRRGYLCGIIRSDGALGHYSYARQGRNRDEHYRFRLALADIEPLERSESYLSDIGIQTRRFAFQAANVSRRPMSAIRTSARANYERIERLIAWPDTPRETWHAGFLAGIFDAEGSYSGGALRISNTDPRLIQRLRQACARFGFRFIVERAAKGQIKPIETVRITGGLREHLRFFHLTDPAILRKREISGQAIKHAADLRVVAIEPLGRAVRMYDITTGTGDFIANGTVAHNCFARPSHSYLGLSPGLDFETKLFYKPDAPEQLARELAAPNYKPTPIALGINTDGWQPIERKTRLTRRILEVLAAHKHPVGIVTKSALIERDLDILAPMAAEGLVSVSFSVTTLDRDLARKLEPRATAPRRRIEAIRRLAAAGVPVGVMVAPVIPALNDRDMERILEAAADAGARSAGYVVLRLPHELAEMFPAWLEAHYPERKAKILSILGELHGGKLYDSRFGTRMRGQGPWARLLAQRFAVARRRYGFTQPRTKLRTDLFQVPGRGKQLDLAL